LTEQLGVPDFLSQAQHLKAPGRSDAVDDTLLASVPQDTLIAEELPAAHGVGRALVRRNPFSDTVCLQKGPQVAVFDAVVSSGCLGRPQLALLDPLQDRVGLYGAKFRRLAGGKVPRFANGRLRRSGIYGFHMSVKL
jgi:hypothetical protein